ncbi:MAG: ATP-binding cassette domain-containing protein [Sulfolobales archaeon]
MNISAKGFSIRLNNLRILENSDLNLDKGLTLLTGVSGSGKTSLLRVLSGSIPFIFKGSFTGFFKPDIRTINRISFYMPQEPWFGIATPYVWSELEGFEELLESIDMKSLRNRSTYTLSAGETQRILLLVALRSGKKLLLLDEPTSYLDSDNARRFAELVYKFSDENDSIVLVSDHRIDLWSKYAEKIYALNNRRLEDFKESSYKEYYERNIRLIEDLRKEREVNEIRNCIGFEIREFTYPGSRRRLLEGVEGEVCYGRVTLIRGASGSGKSTLLRLLTERIVDQRFEKYVRIHLERISQESIKKDILLIPDNPLLFYTEARVFEELGGEVELLDLLEISRERSGLGIKRLSSGERRRIAFLSALARRKKIILVDEPTVGLDPGSKYLLLKLIRDLTLKGYGFLISSHDPHMEVIADEIIRIN